MAELETLIEENRRLRGLLALTVVAIEEHLASPEGATMHVLVLQAACIKEALSRTTEHLEPSPIKEHKPSITNTGDR